MKVQLTEASMWSVGFRPFFILVLLSAVTTTPIWVFRITGFSSFDFMPFSPNQWHANEMIFGFLTAAIIGFLLTASANWTNTRGIHGAPLLIAFSVFLFARIIFWTTPFESIWVYQLVGALVPIFVVLHLARLFVRTKNSRNLILTVPLLTLVFAQYCILTSRYSFGYELGLYAVRFIVVIIAGRVIPFFTKTALKLDPKWTHPYLEKLTMITVFLLIFEPFYRQEPSLGSPIWVGLTTLALILNVYRLISWRFLQSYNVKILFILYLAYLWLPIHFALSLASRFELISELGKPAIHSLAYGCMGIMILGIIHRVTLGHTGRKIHASNLSLAGYLMITLGSLLRVFGPLLNPEHYMLWLMLSGALWVLAFTTIGFEIVPMLVTPRADGKG